VCELTDITSMQFLSSEIAACVPIHGVNLGERQLMLIKSRVGPCYYDCDFILSRKD
jgi:hypothetical protein